MGAIAPIGMQTMQNTMYLAILILNLALKAKIAPRWQLRAKYV